MGKGDVKRPSQITKAEENIRWALAFGKITFEQFEHRYNQLFKEGKIKKNR